MSVVSVAVEALTAALLTVDGLRVYTDPAATVDPPGAVLVPPTLTWEGYGASEPTDATFVVAVVAKNDDRVMERLWELVPLVAAAVDEVQSAVVRRAEPGNWANGDLPAYLIEIEVAL